MKLVIFSDSGILPLSGGHQNMLRNSLLVNIVYKLFKHLIVDIFDIINSKKTLYQSYI